MLLPSEVRAQGTGASIRGVITDETGEPLPGATVQVHNAATGFEAGTATDADGRYRFRQLPLGEEYAVTVSFMGYGEQRKAGFMLNLGDALTVDFTLREEATELDEVVVIGDPLQAQMEQAGASTRIGADEVQELPTQGRNFANLIDLAPTSSGGIGLGGHRTTSTNIRLDGVSGRSNRLGRNANSGPFSVSLEAIREFKIVTNDYDVTQGRQAGGAIDVVTKSGTNNLEGSVFMYHRNEALVGDDFRGNPANEFSLFQWGGSLGGPILDDKLHFYVAFDREDDSSPAYIYDLRSEEDEVAQGLTQENLDRFLGILESEYGLDREQQQVGSFTSRDRAYTLFSRLDWQVNPKHRLTLRNNFNRLVSGDFFGIGTGIYENKGNLRKLNNLAMLSLRSNLSPSLLNELSLQVLHQYSTRDPHSGYLPRGLVSVRSELPDGTEATRTLQFGGNRNQPASIPETQIQLANTSYLQLGDHEVTVGTDNVLTLYDDIYINDRHNGLFFFDSLDDLADRNAYRYVRYTPLDQTLRPSARQQVLDLSLFGQTKFELVRRLSAQVGMRYDVTTFLHTPAYNPTADEELGLRTDRRPPTDWNNLQPRLQLTWDIRGDRTEVLKVGGGAFMAQPHHAPFYNIDVNSGTKLAEVTLNDEDVPTPDFERYRQDPMTIPGVPEGAGTTPAAVEVIAEDFARCL